MVDMPRSPAASTLPPELSALIDQINRGEPVELAPQANTKERRFSILDGFRAEIEAGIPDSEITRRTGIRAPTIRKWKTERGVAPVNHAEEAAHATSVFGNMNPDPLARAAGSPLVGGGFDPPQYILRKPLNYPKFCEYVYHLCIELSEPMKDVAEGVGVRPQDVETACLLWAAKMQRESENGR